MRTELRSCSLLPTHQLPCYGCCALNPEADWLKVIFSILHLPCLFNSLFLLCFWWAGEVLCVQAGSTSYIGVFRLLEDASLSPAPAGFFKSSTHWRLRKLHKRGRKPQICVVLTFSNSHYPSLLKWINSSKRRSDKSKGEISNYQDAWLGWITQLAFLKLASYTAEITYNKCILEKREWSSWFFSL